MRLGTSIMNVLVIDIGGTNVKIPATVTSGHPHIRIA
jgi:hexokinase